MNAIVSDEIKRDIVGISRLPKNKLATALEQMSELELHTALWQIRWNKQARRKQLMPRGVDWFTWLILAGRGFGKTRTGAEAIGWQAWKHDDTRWSVIAPTMGDCRATCFEGVSGLLNVIPKQFIENYNRSTLELWLTNRSKIQGFSAEKPDRLRGPQHHGSWKEELAAWPYTVDTWDNSIFGLRLGPSPFVCVTTTPKPKKLLREIVNSHDTIVVKGNSYENRANLSPKFIEKLSRYEGTRIGRQEIHAELLDQADGALWNRKLLDRAQVKRDRVPKLKRVVVALDPAVSANENSNEFGIVVAGLGVDNHGYVLEDHTGIYTPAEWSKRAVGLYVCHHADAIVGEANNGGDMIEQTIRTADHPAAKRANFKKVWASKGKATRAEPVSALYEKNEVHHVIHDTPVMTEEDPRSLAELEDEMCTWEPKVSKVSPNRMDALVWAITELMLEEQGQLVSTELW